MEHNYELNNLTCPVKDHSNMKVIGFCVQENCLNKNKFACQECFFDSHSGHKLIKIENICYYLCEFISGFYNNKILWNI